MPNRWRRTTSKGSLDSDILHRHFLAIATSTYNDPCWPALPVEDEVRTLADWFCSEQLGDRRFTQEYPQLAHSPTEAQIRAALKNPGRKWDRTDAAVVYITGHGFQQHQEHRLILRETSTGEILSTALRTADIIGWLTETGIEHLLLIIDTCYASDVAGGVVRLRKPLPKTWLVLASAAQDQVAMAGALTGAIQQVLNDSGGKTGEKYGLDRYLRVEDFIGDVEEKLGDSQPLMPVHGSQTRGFHVCLPNPKYRPADIAPTRPQRRDLSLLKSDMEIHWEPRSWLFTGRAELMRRLIAAANGEPGAVLVTGSAGSGKSAALARLVTLSDPDFRSRYADQVALIPAELLPREEAVEVSVLATGKNAAMIMTQICRAVGALDAPRTEPTLQAAQGAWREWARQGTQALTIVIDALDEAANPGEVLDQVLRQLADPGSDARRVRLIVGVRSAGGIEQDGAVPRERSLADRVQRDLGIEPGGGRIQVDSAPWWVREDVVGYITSLLRLLPNSPYSAAEAGTVRAIADKVADKAGKSFLFANMAARQLAARDTVVAIGDSAWRTSISEGVLGLFREDLRRTLPDPEDQRWAVDLLRAVAFAFGPGLPWRNIWPMVATAIGDGRFYGDSDIATLLGTRLGGYLVTDRADEVTVYRLFHDDLRNILCERWEELLAP